MKKHKLAKNALNHPELFTSGELVYFKLWLQERKKRKEKKRLLRRLHLEKSLLL